MEKNDKKILIIVSSIFLIALAFILFITFQSRDNMISNYGRYNGNSDIRLGDTTCGDWEEGSWGEWQSGSSSCYNEAPSNNVSLGESYCQYEYASCSTYYECMGKCGASSCYREKTWTRTCSTVVNEYACYANGNAQGINGVIWTTSSYASEHGLTKLDGVSQSTCNAVANGELCFKDLNNNYYWGYNYITNYTHVSGVTSESSCGASSSTTPKCYCNDAGSCSRQYATTSAFPNLSDDSNCSINSINGNTIIAISGDETIVGTYNVKNSSDKIVDASSWSKSGSNMTLGDDCIANSSTCHISYTNETACTNKTVTVSASDGTNTKSLNVNVYHFNAWSGPYDVGPVEESERILHHTRDNEKFLSDCEAYEDWTQDSTTGKWYGKMYYRCCGTPPVTPSEPEYCYIKRGNGTDNTYCHGTATTCSGFTETITSTTCSETPACYRRDSDNTYVTGKFSGQSGYTYYGTTCPTAEQEYCYIKRGNGTDNTYCKGTATACSGFTETITSTTCSETAACYMRESDNTYVIGKFDGQSGYTYYGTTCPIPACYIDEDNNYVWGIHDNDSDYTLVPDKTESTCKDVVPDVPKTAAGVATIVYIAIVALSLAGIGFIVYSNYKRKYI